jgi:hypothetical protein
MWMEEILHQLMAYPIIIRLFSVVHSYLHTNESSRNSPVNPVKTWPVSHDFPITSCQPRRHFCYICYQAWPRWKNVGLTSLTSANIISFWEWLRIRFIGGTYHIYKAYFWGLNFREYPHKIWPEIWY